MKDDLAQKQQWEETIDGACDEADLKPRCLRLDLKVYKKDGRGKISIRNPGPNYADGDNPQYDDCSVENMKPLSPDDGGPEKVPAGSTITVEIICIPVESDETSTPDGTDTPGQQPGKKKDKTSSPDGSGE